MVPQRNQKKGERRHGGQKESPLESIDCAQLWKMFVKLGQSEMNKELLKNSGFIKGLDNTNCE